MGGSGEIRLAPEPAELALPTVDCDPGSKGCGITPPELTTSISWRSLAAADGALFSGLSWIAYPRPTCLHATPSGGLWSGYSFCRQNA